MLESPAHTEEVVASVRPITKRRFCSHSLRKPRVAMENARLVDAIQNLFEKFVHASVKAIEVRDKSTQGHSERVAALTVAQARAINDDRQRRPRRTCTLRRSRCAKCATHRCCTISAKSPFPNTSSAKAKKLPDGTSRHDTLALPARDRTGASAKTTTAKRCARCSRNVESANEPQRRRRRKARRDAARRDWGAATSTSDEPRPLLERARVRAT